MCTCPLVPKEEWWTSQALSLAHTWATNCSAGTGIWLVKKAQEIKPSERNIEPPKPMPVVWRNSDFLSEIASASDDHRKMRQVINTATGQMKAWLRVQLHSKKLSGTFYSTAQQSSLKYSFWVWTTFVTDKNLRVYLGVSPEAPSLSWRIHGHQSRPHSFPCGETMRSTSVHITVLNIQFMY